MTIVPILQDYPVHGFIPKQDTQAGSFIKKFPNYDGRNTVIAILDTGVDPGAAGMQVTTDGKPKIIDIVDCTGGGDVETTKVVKPTIENGNRVIEGLSGRKLIISDKWNNPSDEYRVGVKRSYELFPKDLTKRIKAERRESFLKKQAQLLTEAQTKLADYIREGKVNDATKSDLETRIEMLKELDKSYEDPGLLFDCVVYFDGRNWRAVIDTQESGDLREQPCLADYRKELQYHTFGEADLLNYSVNIYDNGNVLSIVTLAGTHGTHVAGITAAHFPDEPSLNGIAPGAQIVSLRIGDARFGSMETGPGLSRAASHIAKHKVDLANMSYGEANSLPNTGHFINLLAKEAIGKSGCIFVTSAGNSGPCLNTMTAPGGMDESFITVGAYVGHEQMQAEYSLIEPVTERPFTFSSLGPTVDGYHGVDIYAPGSAITSVPVYGLNKLNLKNGTSMASPNACGCISLLVSGLKAEGHKYSPYRLKTAITQTGKSVNDTLGVRFIQVDKAWQYLENNKERDDLDILFKVTTSKGRGIYLRELEEVSRVQYIDVKLEPTFLGELDPEKPLYNKAKFNFESRVVLVTTKPWISSPEYVYLNSSGNLFQVKVDPSSLSESDVHLGEVIGYDSSSPDRGPLFRVPVVVVKPSVPSQGFIRYKNVEYGSGDIVRRFVQVPDGATCCDITLKAHAPLKTAPARFALHLMQLVPQKSHKKRHAFSLMLGNGSFGDPSSDEQVIRKRVSVRGGLSLEVCVAQFWNGLGKHSVDLSLDFHGVQIAGNLTNGEGVLHLEPEVTRLDVCSSIRREEALEVRASFNKLRKYIPPTESTITPMLPDRDMLPTLQLTYQLVLTYQFKIDASTSITARFPPVMNQLYEHYLAGVFGIIYDANKKVVGYVDVFEHSYKIKQKGDYFLRLQLSSPEESVLDQLKSMLLELDVDVKTVSFNTFQTMGDVYQKESSNFSKLTLERKDARVFYVAAPATLPKDAKPGDALVGQLNFLEKVTGGQYQVLYKIPPTGSEKSSQQKKTPDENLEKKFSDAKLSLELSYLKKFSTDSDAYKQLLNSVKSTYGNDVAFLECQMDAVWSSSAGKHIHDCLLKPSQITTDEVAKIIQYADTILDQLNQNELLEFYGRKRPDKETDDQKERRKENDGKKKQVIHALKNKAAACLVGPKKELLETTLSELAQWTSDDSASNLTSLLIKVQHDRENGHFGAALKSVQKYLSEATLNQKTVKDVEKVWSIRNELFSDLCWNLWKEYDTKWNLIRQPPYGFALF